MKCSLTLVLSWRNSMPSLMDKVQVPLRAYEYVLVSFKGSLLVLVYPLLAYLACKQWLRQPMILWGRIAY